MSDNKKYYYLKLKDNFFDNEEMKLLETQKNGIEYQNFYLKLCLLSLKNEGRLMFRESIPYDINMLSIITRHNIDTVQTCINIFKNMGLIDILETGAIYMNDIQKLIGRGSSEAERIAKYRDRKNNEINSVTMLQNCTPEIEIEIEIELEKEIDIDNIKYKETTLVKKEKNKFIPPTIEEVKEYFIENGYRIDIAEKAYNYYNIANWKDRDGKQVKNWKQKMLNNWMKEEYKIPKKQEPIKIEQVEEISFEQKQNISNKINETIQLLQQKEIENATL